MRLHPLQTWLVLCLASSLLPACPSTSRRERKALTTPALRENCQPLHEFWRSQLLGDEPNQDGGAEELQQRLASFPCALALDLDGDGAEDRAFVTSVSGTIQVGVTWSDKRQAVLSLPQEKISEFSWLQAWKPAKKNGDYFEIEVLGKTRDVEAGDARGDGLWVSGGDAAAILYWDGTAWAYLALGY